MKKSEEISMRINWAAAAADLEASDNDQEFQALKADYEAARDEEDAARPRVAFDPSKLKHGPIIN